MSIRKIAADSILTCTGSILKNHTIILNSDDTILDILPSKETDDGLAKKYTGWILPGFINTHCHLELSHMKDLLPTGTGLIPFIKGVVTQRAAHEEVLQDAIARADQEMWDGGIMAVGDISNTTDSFDVKSKSRIKYYSFIEAFDLMQPKDTDNTFQQYAQVYSETPGRKSFVPHAPYSCTPELIKKINEVNSGKRKTISIHNQETVHENNFFLSKTGELITFYEEFGLTVAHFTATNQTSIHYLLDHIDPAQRYLFVHNTLTTKADYEAACAGLGDVFWATCANANLFIENALPDYQMFLDASAQMTIGTDSLASNWQLSVWDELLAIKRYNSYLPNEALLTWACINGAKALGFDDMLGSIEVGKNPGLLHIETNDTIEDLIQDKNKPTRIL